MSAADLVAVASIGSSLQVLTDCTSSKERVRDVLSAFATTDGTAFTAVDASSLVLSQAGDSGDETALLDVPWSGD